MGQPTDAINFSQYLTISMFPKHIKLYQMRLKLHQIVHLIPLFPAFLFEDDDSSRLISNGQMISISIVLDGWDDILIDDTILRSFVAYNLGLFICWALALR